MEPDERSCDNVSLLSLMSKMKFKENACTMDEEAQNHKECQNHSVINYISSIHDRRTSHPPIERGAAPVQDDDNDC